MPLHARVMSDATATRLHTAIRYTLMGTDSVEVVPKTKMMHSDLLFFLERCRVLIN
jgi:hypothetical protein